MIFIWQKNKFHEKNLKTPATAGVFLCYNGVMEIMRGAEPFCLDGKNKKAVLLVHGYTGSPSQMAMLGHTLNQAGYTVYAPLLAGHGTCVEDLQETTANDWYNSVLESYNKLNRRYDDIAVVGVSLGGLLAIRLAAEKKVSKLVCVATPMALFDRRLRWLWLLKRFVDYAKKRPNSYPVDDNFNVSYKDKIPVKPLPSMMDLMKKCRRYHLNRITVPVLALHGGLDRTAKPESADLIVKLSRGKDKQSLILQDSGHMVLLDKQRAFAEQQIVEFLNR